MLDRITFDPNMIEGEPTVRDLGIKVDSVLRLLGEGYDADDVLREYPELEKEDVYQAMIYASWRALDRTPKGRSVLYIDLIVNALSEAGKRKIEEEARLGKLPALSDRTKHILNLAAIATVRGETLGEAVLTVLAARDLRVADDARDRVTAERDLEVLSRWLQRAATAERAEDVFSED